MSKSSEKGAAVAEGEEEKLLEEVAGQMQGRWRKLDQFEDIEERGEIGLQSDCCPCYRFGKKMGRAGCCLSFVQGIMYTLVAATALANFTAFIVTEKRYFLYLGLAFTISLATYMGYCLSQIRKRFNIRSLEKLPSLLTPLPNQQEISPFGNVSTSTPSSVSASKSPSSQAPVVENFNFPNLKIKSNNGAVQDSEKSSAEPTTLKRSRIETPSPLPTLKVRKEKLGDRITALQQLVSPFGKTDTASVLLEAIGYIKFLHNQVNVLSTPYEKNGTPIQQQNNENSKDSEGPKQDLRERGLCLVPISSTFLIANGTTVDFWTPNFGGSFR